MTDLPRDKKLILFDGLCNLCNESVLKVIRYDKKNKFVFTAMQSEAGQQILNHLKIDSSKIDSIVLYEPSVSYDIKSNAALKIMSDFGGFWKTTQLFFILPRFFRDFFYDFIAKNRYRWFGKKEKCMIPTKDIREKFI